MKSSSDAILTSSDVKHECFGQKRFIHTMTRGGGGGVKKCHAHEGDQVWISDSQVRLHFLSTLIANNKVSHPLSFEKIITILQKLRRPAYFPIFMFKK